MIEEHELIEKVFADPIAFILKLNIFLETEHNIKIEYDLSIDSISIKSENMSSTLYFVYFTDFEQTKSSLNSLIQKLTEYNINLNDYIYKCF